jgi:tetratricopeptide (TPR) repeat protein
LATTWLLLGARLATGPRPHSAGFSSGLSAWTYLMNQPEAITRYLTLAIWPRSLVLLYGWPREITVREALPYVLVILSLLALTFVAVRRRPKAGFLGVCFWLTLAPASSVIPIATEVAAERRMYLPLAALVLLGAVGLVRLGEALRQASWATPRRTRLATLTAASLLATVSGALASATIARNEEYASAVVMARTVLQRHPTPIAHLMLARALLDAGQRSEAMDHLQQALPAPGARFTLGMELLTEGRAAEGMVELRAFVADQRPFLQDVILARLAMGHVLMDQEHWISAEREFRLVLDSVPGNPSARQQLADAVFAQGLWEEAIVQYRAYLAQMPHDPGALNNLGVALGSSGKLEDAKAAFRRALEIDSSYGPA